MLDLRTGAIKWGARPAVRQLERRLRPEHTRRLHGAAHDNCPNPKGPDWDFAQGPMLFGGGGGDRDHDRDDDRDRDDDNDLVGAGQKSGMFWAFKAHNGKLAWAAQAAPPGLTGGLQWGSGSDGKRIYFAAANSGLTGAGTTPIPWQLKAGGTTLAGGWGALNPENGKLIWNKADPLGSRAEAAVSVANGVLFGCTLDAANGTMDAMDAKTGATLWSRRLRPIRFWPDRPRDTFICSCATSRRAAAVTHRWHR